VDLGLVKVFLCVFCVFFLPRAVCLFCVFGVFSLICFELSRCL